MRIILQVDDFRSYDSILQINIFKNIFKDSMDLTIHYKVFKNTDMAFDAKNCLKDGDKTYCVVSGETE